MLLEKFGWMRFSSGKSFFMPWNEYRIPSWKYTRMDRFMKKGIFFHVETIHYVLKYFSHVGVIFYFMRKTNTWCFALVLLSYNWRELSNFIYIYVHLIIKYLTRNYRLLTKLSGTSESKIKNFVKSASCKSYSTGIYYVYIFNY